MLQEAGHRGCVLVTETMPYSRTKLPSVTQPLYWEKAKRRGRTDVPGLQRQVAHPFKC